MEGRVRGMGGGWCRLSQTDVRTCGMDKVSSTRATRSHEKGSATGDLVRQSKVEIKVVEKMLTERYRESQRNAADRKKGRGRMGRIVYQSKEGVQHAAGKVQPAEQTTEALNNSF